MLLYTDASISSDVVGVGYVLEPTIENVKKFEGNTYLLGDYTSMEGEYLALLIGTCYANELDASTLYIQSDCQPLLDKMYYPDENRVWFERRKVFHRLMENFDSWKTVHIPRALNEKADTLATVARYRGEDLMEEVE